MPLPEPSKPGINMNIPRKHTLNREEAVTNDAKGTIDAVDVDIADVDGNNQLDAEELEIVLLSLDPSKEVQPEWPLEFWWGALRSFV